MERSEMTDKGKRYREYELGWNLTAVPYNGIHGENEE